MSKNDQSTAITPTTAEKPVASILGSSAGYPYPLKDHELEEVVVTAISGMAEFEKEEALKHAIELIYEVMTDQINDVDECEKYLRAYAPAL